MIALKSHLVSNQFASSSLPGKQVQTASLLHIEYGMSLRPNIMACDAFYALTEVFQFAAFSEKQFLNLIDVKLEKFAHNEHGSDFEGLSNIKYVKTLLRRHIHLIQESLSSIHNTKHPKWPKAANEPGKKARMAFDAVQQDYKHLLLQAQAMHTRCNEDITVLMNSASIAESKKAMAQAERLGKLTFLAFIFVPLSFTTSFFGMNVQELGQGSLSIWSWFTLSVPMLGFTLLLFYFDLWQGSIDVCRKFYAYARSRR